MKNIIYLLVAASLLCSCTLKQTVVVNGVPGTTIYDCNNNNLGTISTNGRLEMKISENKYHAFLFAATPDGKVIPFGLEYKENRRAAKKIPLILGPYAPTLYYLVSNEQWMLNYSYLKTQNTNEDITFRPIVDNGFRREVLREGKPAAASSEESAGIGTSLRNLAGNIAGEYKGSGRLLTDTGKSAERYTGMTLRIVRLDNRTASVSVLDENGESYFDETQTYAVSKDAEGNYTLTLSGDEAAVINIAPDGTLDYLHPHIAVDGKNYSLMISANR